MNKYLMLAVALAAAVGLIVVFKPHELLTFKKIAPGVRYKIEQKGEGPTPAEGETILAEIVCTTKDGKEVFNTNTNEVPVAIIPYSEKTLKQQFNFHQAVGQLHKGTVAVIRGSIKDLGPFFADLAKNPNLKEIDVLNVRISVKDILNQQAFQEWAKEQLMMIQKRNEERKQAAQEKAEKQLKDDVEKIDAHIKEQKLDEQHQINKTPSGLRYIILKQGGGAKPTKGKKVKINYTGRTLEGNVFDSNIEQDAKNSGVYDEKRNYQPLQFEAGQGHMIKGMEEVISFLSKGSKAKVFLPSGLGYGAQGAGDRIAPDTILVFDVEVVDIQ